MSDESEELERAIQQAALEPAAGSDAAGSFKAQSIADMIAAYRFKKSLAQQASSGIGVRKFRIRGNGFES